MYLANGNGLALTSDDCMLTLTLGSYAPGPCISTSLARYTTATQLNAKWLHTQSDIMSHALLTSALQTKILTQEYTRSSVDDIFSCAAIDIATFQSDVTTLPRGIYTKVRADN